MTKQSHAISHNGQLLSSDDRKHPVIPHEPSRQAFEELSELYKENQNQISRARKLIRMLSGDSNNPGTLWRSIEAYGSPLGTGDCQEHILRHKGYIWSIRRSNSRVRWDADSALALFKLAYTLHNAEDGSEKQTLAFDEFQCLLEKLLNTEVVLDSEAWWKLIDDAADLYRTAVVRTVDVNALDSVVDSIPTMLVDALTVRIEAEYGLHVQCDSDNLPQKITACGECQELVDEEDFFCKYCGAKLGQE